MIAAPAKANLAFRFSHSIRLTHYSTIGDCSQSHVYNIDTEHYPDYSSLGKDCAKSSEQCS